MINVYLCSVKRILLIQTAFIGDVILATPVMAELKRIYPQIELDVLVRKGNETLLVNNPAINQIYCLDKKQGKFASLKLLLKQFRAKKYDEVINLHRFGSSGFLTAFSGAKSKVGFSKNPFSFFYTLKIQHELKLGIHEVERNLACIEHHGAVSKRRPEIFPSISDLEKVKDLQNQNYYCLAPASIWFTKQLPEHKWIELGKILVKKGTVYLVGGPNDSALCDRIVKEINSENSHNLAGKYSFLQSAALFKNAQMNYVNDSGPLHFCSAVNAPVTAFFCSTSPEFGFGPLSDQSRIIESGLLPCKPCGLHGYKACPKGHFKCGEQIHIDSELV